MLASLIVCLPENNNAHLSKAWANALKINSKANVDGSVTLGESIPVE